MQTAGQSRTRSKENDYTPFSATTPGQFFHMRAVRNSSQMNRNDGLQQTVFSKSFNNYMRARENIQNQAKEHIEKLNRSALQKVKHQKQAEKTNREQTIYKKMKLEKIQEK